MATRRGIVHVMTKQTKKHYTYLEEKSRLAKIKPKFDKKALNKPKVRKEIVKKAIFNILIIFPLTSYLTSKMI